MATVTLPIAVESARLKTTNVPELVNIAGTNFPVGGYAMDASAVEHLYFQFIIPLFGASNTTITCVVDWYSRTGQTSGNAIFGAAVGCITPGDAVSVEAKALATATTAGATTVNATAKGLTTTTVTIANIDSCAALDQVELDVFVNGGTMTGDRIITSIYLQYSDT